MAGMSQRYTLHIHGSIPVSLAEGEPLPTTQAALRDLLEDYEVDLCTLDELELSLTPGHLPQYRGIEDC
jgi:hypothetical protein